MKRILKQILSLTYQPLLKQYLSQRRSFRYQDILIEVPSGVFHPGFFFSTRYLLDYLKKLPLTDKTLLELGCGSGLISVYAARQGAKVLASDINPKAVEAARVNSVMNETSIEVLRSDLFEMLDGRTFDYMIINPPYFHKDPDTMEEHAWYCGKDFDYFQRLFRSMHDHIHERSKVIMILSEDCQIRRIEQLANSHGLQLKLQNVKQNILERNFIFTIEPAYIKQYA